MAKTERYQPRQLLIAFFQVIRWKNLLIVALAHLLSWYCIIHQEMGLGFSWLALGHLSLLSLATMLIAGAGNIINDYYDVKIDAVNKPNAIIVNRYISRRHAMFLHTVLNLVALMIVAMAAWYLVPLFGGVAFLLWWYSNRLKQLPLVGNIVVAFLTALGVFVPALLIRGAWLPLGFLCEFRFLVKPQQRDN